MERIVTAQEAKSKDMHAYSAFRLNPFDLMATAAHGIADAVRACVQNGETVTAICGTGNNGGDGVAAALFLFREGVDARIVLCGDAERCAPDTKHFLRIAAHEGVPITSVWEPTEREIIIDALFGIGLNRPIEGEKKELIERINASGRTVVSADIPSGLHADSGRILGTAIRAGITVTMQAKKAGMLLGKGREVCGDVRVQPLFADATETKDTIDV